MKLTPEKLSAFCHILAETCNVGKACAAVDISRYTAYKWRKEMPDFAAMWDEAMQAGVLALEDEAHRRAFAGADKLLTHKGQIIYKRDYDAIDPETGQKYAVPPLLRDKDGRPIPETVKEYSDTLAIFLLKAHAPDKYRERSTVDQNISGAVSVTVVTGVPRDDDASDLL